MSSQTASVHALQGLDSSPLLTLLDPPETKPHLSETDPSTGADRRWSPPGCSAITVIMAEPDPLADPDGTSVFRHSGWAKDRRRVYDALRACGTAGNRLRSFAGCGRHAFIYECVERPGEFSIGGSACHDRFCMPCSRERSRVIATNVLEQIGDRQARFITLTLKSTSEPLTVLLARLTDSFTRLRRTKLWRNKVVGGVAFIEVTWACRSASWHPHFHCLVQGRYLPRKELSQAWHKITGDSYITDIRFARDNSHVTHYITKYATKTLDHSVTIDPANLREAVVALKGKRLCLTFGTWRGLCLTKRIEDGTWIQLGSLAEFIRRASSGDSEAESVLTTLRIPYATSPRGPPSETAKVVSGSVHSQLTINFDGAFRTQWDAN